MYNIIENTFGRAVMNKKLFGILDTGAEVYEYTLKNDQAEVSFITLGAAIRTFKVFGRDIVGGYDRIEDYISDDSHQGGVIGRVANRVGGAKFTMDGKEYRLPKNDGENCLHGGVGFDRRIFDVADVMEGDNPSEDSICFTYTSKDGEEGFPGEVALAVSYTLSGTELRISYVAIPSEKTPIALTNHAYFNLCGLGSDVLGHKIKIYADRYTEVGDDLIPNGNRPALFGTPFDLNEWRVIGDGIKEIGGYDHNYIVKPREFKSWGALSLGLIAEVVGGDLKMQVYSDQPGVQLYTGNFLGGEPDFKGGIKRIKHGALCLETQTEPDCINHGIGFYESGEIYSHNTVYKIERTEE